MPSAYDVPLIPCLAVGLRRAFVTLPCRRLSTCLCFLALPSAYVVPLLPCLAVGFFSIVSGLLPLFSILIFYDVPLLPCLASDRKPMTKQVPTTDSSKRQRRIATNDPLLPCFAFRFRRTFVTLPCFSLSTILCYLALLFAFDDPLLPCLRGSGEGWATAL